VLVDGTNGDTILKPVNGTLGTTNFKTSGGILKRDTDLRRTIKLDVSMPSGNLVDILTLAMKGPPFMQGKIFLKTTIVIPPLTGKVREKLVLDGQFEITQGKFLRSTIQNQIDSLSRRGRGQPENEEIDSVVSAMAGKFKLEDETLTFRSLSFAVPGSGVDLAGTYDLDQDALDFHGTLRLEATVSQTMTGWKRWVLKPVDPFFSKEGSGTLLRIQVVGSSKEPKFGRERGDQTPGKDRLRRPPPERRPDAEEGRPDSAEKIGQAPTSVVPAVRRERIVRTWRGTRLRRGRRLASAATHPGREVTSTEADHVLPRHLIALGRHIHRTPSACTALVEDVRERNRRELASLDGDERTRPALEQVGHGGVSEIARVLGIERNRRRASQLVPNRLVDDRHLDAACLQPHLNLVLDFPSEVDLRDPDVALCVAVDVLKLRNFLRAEPLDKRLGQERDAVRLAHRPPLDDAAFDDVGDVGERDQPLRELLGMIVQVALTALPMPSVKWPVGRPIVTPRYQRPVVFASSMRLFTMPTPVCRAVS
jgi:hypothetical protein